MSFKSQAIPSDWRVHTLAELGGKVTSGSRGWAKYYAEHGSLFVRITNLDRSDIHLDLRDSRFVQVDPHDAEACRTRLAPGDLLISITADIGIIGYVDSSTPDPAYINQHIARVRLDPRRVDSRFVAYYLASWEPQRRFVGSTDQGAKAGINLTTVAALSSVVPPLEEQSRIADALADADGLIAILDRSIAKRQAIKQGMMQQLLTGRTRLPGFSKPWREIRLGEVARFSKGAGLPKSAIALNGSAPCIHYGELFTHYGSEIEAVTSRTNNLDLSIRSEAFDVLMPTSDVTPRGLAKASAVNDAGVILGGDILIIRADGRDLYGPFLAYAIRRDANQVLQLVRGSTVFHIYAADMKNFALGVPCVEEQRMICSVLRDTELEINELSKRLAKARDVKTGMMQQLLTGRTRLPVQEAAA